MQMKGEKRRNKPKAAGRIKNQPQAARQEPIVSTTSVKINEVTPWLLIRGYHEKTERAVE